MTSGAAETGAHVATDTPTGGRLPDFIVVGAMKAGTTTLYAYLAQHPQIYMCQRKEPGFFSRNENYAKGMDWYRQLYTEAAPDQLCGEASTCYTRQLEFPSTAARIAKHIPDAKLIYLVRHPVERAYSHYVHLMAQRWTTECRAPLPLSSALQEYPTIVDTSKYSSQLERYLTYFSRKNLMVIVLDDLAANPEASVAAAHSFLGLREFWDPTGGHLHMNPSGLMVAHRAATKRFGGYKKRLWGALLRRLLPRRARAWLRSLALERLRRTATAANEVAAFRDSLEDMPPAVRERLLGEFEESTAWVEHFTGRQLPAWRK